MRHVPDRALAVVRSVKNEDCFAAFSDGCTYEEGNVSCCGAIITPPHWATRLTPDFYNRPPWALSSG